MRAALVTHPTTPSSQIESIAVDIEPEGDDMLLVRYQVCGAIDSILWPEPDAALRTDKLWEHTCFELFVGTPYEPAYVELNFSPSARWAAYRFDAYRSGMREQSLAQPPHIVCRYGSNRMHLDVTLPRTALVLANDSIARLALSAVIEDERAAKTYWALAHPADTPDFHHTGAFKLELGHAEA